MARPVRFLMNRPYVRGLAFAIAGFVVACLGTVPASAMEANLKSRLTWDFDGDHKTDLAVGGFSDSTFTIRVQFSDRLKHVVLRTKIARQSALNLSALDVDQDNDVDIILTGASFRPLAVWFNQGNGKFKKTSHWFFPPLYRDTGGQINRATRKNETEFGSALERPTVFLVTAPPVTLDPPAGGECFPVFVCSSIDPRCRNDFSRGPPL